MTVIIRPTATVTIDGDDFTPASGSECSLEAPRVPYATARIMLPIPADGVVDYLDPREAVRATTTFGEEGGATRSFDLGLQSRTIDHVQRMLTLELASDEAILQDYAPLIVDEGAREFETSIRDVVNYVLGKIGAELEPGDPDMDVSAAWELTNLVTNPHADTTVGYIPGVNAGSVTVGTTSPWEGTGYVRWVAPASGNSFLAVPVSDTRVQEGERFEFHAVLRASSAGQQGRAYIQYKDSEGVVLTTISPAGPLSTLATGTGWTEVGVSVTIPAGVASAQPYVVGVGSAGITYAVDAPYFYESNEYVDFWTGDSSDATYTYEWAGVPNESPSVRTPVVERRPETFVWLPGVSAWEFLLPLTVSTGMVLWCDEQRRWRLAPPESRSTPVLIAVNEGNTTRGTETIDRSDSETFSAGVVVEYTWRDSFGREQVRYDSAGEPGKVLTIKLDRPYPGPGVAAAILARRQGTGRRQDVTTVTQVNTTPGMVARVTLPGTPETDGRVAAVRFDLATGYMTLDLAGLIDVTPGSIAALTGFIDDLAGFIDDL